MVDAISSSNNSYKVEVQKANEEANEAAYQAVDSAINMKFGSPTAETPEGLGKVEEDFAECAKKIFDEKKEQTFADKMKTFLSGLGNNKQAESKPAEGGGYGVPSKENNISGGGWGKPANEHSNESKPDGGGYGVPSKENNISGGGWGKPADNNIQESKPDGGGYGKKEVEDNQKGQGLAGLEKILNENQKNINEQKAMEDQMEYDKFMENKDSINESIKHLESKLDEIMSSEQGNKLEIKKEIEAKLNEMKTKMNEMTDIFNQKREQEKIEFEEAIPFNIFE